MIERHPMEDLERTICGLERCGYHVFAVTRGPEIRGWVEVLPDTDKRTPRAERKWRLKWQEILCSTPRRTIAQYLAGTGRTRAAAEARAKRMAQISRGSRAAVACAP